MSDKSSHALLMEKEGFLKPFYEWQGTLENTWIQCVENNNRHLEEDISYRDVKCSVYLIETNIFGKTIYKIGISGNAFDRFKAHKIVFLLRVLNLLGHLQR